MFFVCRLIVPLLKCNDDTEKCIICMFRDYLTMRISISNLKIDEKVNNNGKN